MSYGGSSMLATMVGFGLILNRADAPVRQLSKGLAACVRVVTRILGR